MLRLITGMMLLVLTLTTASCKKDMMEYEGIVGVYFAARSGPYYAAPNSWPFRSFTNVEFVSQPADVNEVKLQIPVMITGPMKNYDRVFLVEVNPDSTSALEKVHYQAFPRTCTIPANAIQGFVPITVMRTADMLTENKRLGLRLVANENFGLSFPKWRAIPDLGTGSVGADTVFDATLHMININDLMVEPAVWRGKMVPETKQETGLWGVFSRKKLELMCQLLHLTYQDFSSDATMPTILSSLIANEMARYLKDQFNAGTPVKEDDGRLMWCGSVPWTSTVGVPYQ
ncbi:DUF4843 domain-containing protein [Chitinophaga horti]|uniref:DUF4843 domain-containing protein n=1 Tax=Chitinophaga horti TaxID=2920382 RepID=A0ABY6IZ43_9BACT|nr:DUF4843 domain-containing protein [Chitinophaga horti]UYQ92661.1 DUF4843 domain-containing protein [Chitinophaga horti]